MSGNYPADVTSAHPHFNPPDDDGELACEECGEVDQHGGSACSKCGEYVPTSEERDDAAREDAEDRKFDAMREGADYGY